jgi:DNA-binding NtrC family response regulator
MAASGVRENAHRQRTFPMSLAMRSLSVLVVDDEALLRWSLAELLRRGGHSVIEAGSADSARTAIAHASGPIDVVLLDYRLPDSNDLQLLDEIRARLPQSAVVLMTAFGTPEVMQEALDRGAYCVLDKPFDVHGVERLVAEAHQASRYH